MDTNNKILDCGHYPSEHGDFTTGYGVEPGTGKKFCHECCAQWEREQMINTGRAALYYDEKNHTVTDWPGQLRFNLCVEWAGSHNWWCIKNVVFMRFIGPDGAVWTGKHFNSGYNQIVYCKRTKIRPQDIKYIF